MVLREPTRYGGRRNVTAAFRFDACGGLFERVAETVGRERIEHHAQGIGFAADGLGPGVNVRLHDAQRQSWTISSFFLRVPRRVSTWLPQCGHASGVLDECGARAARGIGDMAVCELTIPCAMIAHEYCGRCARASKVDGCTSPEGKEPIARASA